MKILLVEDDERISDAIIEDLTDRHYVVEAACDGKTAWELLEVFTYDLILLDLMLPKMDGMAICQKLRRRGCATPILMLTARDTLTDRVSGLDAGADDYLLKPFELEELSARIRALSRRNSATQSPVLEWGDLCLDPNTCEVEYGMHSLTLSPTEYRLLEFFLRHGRRTFTKAQLIDQVWSFEQLPGEATLKTHMRSLRQKLAAAGAPPDLIETVYGLGYRLKQKT